MAGMFDDFGLDSSAIVAPGAIPEGQYPAYVFKFEMVDKKVKNPGDEGKRNLCITYKITDHPLAGETVREYKSANATDDNRTKGWLKSRLTSLGIPESKMGSLTPDQVVGTPVFVKVKKNGDFTNVADVTKRDTSHEVGPGSSPSVGALTGAGTSEPEW